MLGKGAFHLAPAGAFVLEDVAKDTGDGVLTVGEGASADFFEELEVTLFLTRDEVVDEHRAAGGDGFVDGGTAGFSDDEVVGGEEFGDLAGPAFDSDAAGVGVFDFAGALVEEADVFPQDDGDVGAWVGVEDRFGDPADVGEFWGGEVEDLEGAEGGVGGDGSELGEGGIHREAGFDDLFRREALLEHRVAGVGVSDDPGGCWGVDPGGVDLDGIGDDGENGRFLGLLGEDAVEEVGVNGVSGDDGVGLEFFDEFGEFVFRLAH